MHGSKQLLRGDLGGLLFCKRNGMFLFMLLRMQNRSWLETQFAHPSFFEKDKTVVMFHPNRPLPEKITEFSESHLCKSCEVRKKKYLMSSPKQNIYNVPAKTQETSWKSYKERKSQGMGQSALDLCLLDTGWLRHSAPHSASVTAAAQDPPTNITSLTLHLQSQHSGGI